MIATRDQADVRSTVSGEKVRMGFDVEATTHLMNVLTDLYSDPEQAVLREYATNARDSHIAAGQKRPIEVQLPSPLSPFLIVRDYGVGLDAEDIRSIYSQYGASTKRGTNDQVGMLGLGCKSALTYTDQFTLVGRKHGMQYTVNVSRDEDGAGSMTVVSTEPTDQPNGVEVLIPAKRDNEFERKASEFFRYWDEGTVLVNGNAPEPLEGVKLGRFLLHQSPRGGYTRTVAASVVMGGVPYPVARDEVTTDLASGWTFTAFVDVGDVHFTPSREALQMTARTKATLDKLNVELRQAIQQEGQRQVDAVKSKAAALQLAHSFMEPVKSGVVQLTYRGQLIPASVEVPGDGAKLVNLVGNAYYNKGSYHEHTNRVYLAAWHHATWVTGYTAKYTAEHRRRLAQFAAKHGERITRFVLVYSLPNDPWIEDVARVSWDEVLEATRAPKVPGQRSRNTDGLLRYSVLLPDTDYVHKVDTLSADELKAAKQPVYWIESNYGSGLAFRRALGERCIVVVLPEPRVAKFQRLFPKVRNIRDVVTKRFKAWERTLTDTERMALANRGNLSTYKHLDASRILDPRIKKLAEAATIKVDADQADRYSRVGCTIKSTTKLAFPWSDYPLLDTFHRLPKPGKRLDHLYLYLNTAYKEASK